jgi:hypothetical protein
VAPRTLEQHANLKNFGPSPAARTRRPLPSWGEAIRERRAYRSRASQTSRIVANTRWKLKAIDSERSQEKDPVMASIIENHR